MKNIEIVTAQKVEISYPLASVVQRAVAFFIDLVIIGFGVWLLIMLISWLAPRNWSVSDNLEMLLISPFIMFYTLVSESLMHGQTLGKKALNIRVIKLSGERLEFSDFVIRWLFRVVDIWFSSGSLALILIVSGERRQRLGGILSNTCVIQTHASRNYALSDVLNIMKLKNYTVSYSNAKQFTEPQMLVLKETLERYKHFPNEAHKNALIHLAKTIAKDLEVSKISSTPEQFLRTVLRDYIYLTR